MDDELVLLQFGTVEEAEKALGTLRGLQAEGFITFDDAAVITRDSEGWVTAEDENSGHAMGSTALGGLLGLVAGGLLTVPLIGAVAGAGLVARKYLGDDHLDALLEKVGGELAPGSAVLALTVSALDDPETVSHRLQVHRDALIRAQIPTAVRERLGEA